MGLSFLSEMEYVEIIAKLKDLGHISENREQKIELENVAELSGTYLIGNFVKIYICDSETSRIIDSVLKEYKK